MENVPENKQDVRELLLEHFALLCEEANSVVEPE